MKLISWNVNGIRAAVKKGFEEFFEESNADIFDAIDKAIGFGLRAGIPLSECILYTSGRVPVDVVEKAITAGVPILAGSHQLEPPPHRSNDPYRPVG